MSNLVIKEARRLLELSGGDVSTLIPKRYGQSILDVQEAINVVARDTYGVHVPDVCVLPVEYFAWALKARQVVRDMHFIGLEKMPTNYENSLFLFTSNTYFNVYPLSSIILLPEEIPDAH